MIKKDLLTAAGYSDDSLAYKDCALIELLTGQCGGQSYQCLEDITFSLLIVTELFFHNLK